jgi:hypothetical protein
MSTEYLKNIDVTDIPNVEIKNNSRDVRTLFRKIILQFIYGIYFFAYQEVPFLIQDDDNTLFLNKKEGINTNDDKISEIISSLNIFLNTGYIKKLLYRIINGVDILKRYLKIGKLINENINTIETIFYDKSLYKPNEIILNEFIPLIKIYISNIEIAISEYEKEKKYNVPTALISGRKKEDNVYYKKYLKYKNKYLRLKKLLEIKKNIKDR